LIRREVPLRSISLPHVDGDRLSRTIEMLAAIGRDPEGGVTRMSFTQEDVEAREAVKGIMSEELGLVVRVDPIGNIFGRWEGMDPDRPVIILGSHLDSVRNGGKYDGSLGVLMGLELIRVLQVGGIRTLHSIEVAVFSSEEPNQFSISTLGSRAMTGKLDLEMLKRATGKDGLSLEKAVARIGGDLSRLGEVRWSGREVCAYLEMHVEQTRELWDRGIPVGIVTDIVGIRRARITIWGEANHAGTTPMERRRDALVAAAEVILGVEGVCRERGLNNIVGTVGRLCIRPNAENIIPGYVELIAEIRSIFSDAITEAWRELNAHIQRIEARRGTKVEIEIIYDSVPAQMDQTIVEALERACQQLGVPYLKLPSLAGHDAGHLASITRAGMVFVPSRDGKSHCPEEWSDIKDITVAGEVMLEALLDLDKNLN